MHFGLSDFSLSWGSGYGSVLRGSAWSRAFTVFDLRTLTAEAVVLGAGTGGRLLAGGHRGSVTDAEKRFVVDDQEPW